MVAKLFCKTGQLKGASFIIEKEATIGKSNTNTIVLYPEIISKRHARIYFDEQDQCYYLEDLGSSNGTLLDGYPVTKKEKLHNLHIITFAKTFDFIFQVVDEQKEPIEKSRSEAPGESEEKTIMEEGIIVTPDLPEEKTEDSAEKTQIDQEVFQVPELEKSAVKEDEKDKEETPVEKTIYEADKAFVTPDLDLPEERESKQTPEDVTRMDGEVIQAPEIEAENIQQVKPGVTFVLECKNLNLSIPLKEGENVVGRSEKCDIHLNDPSVSRRHALFTVKSGEVWLKDLESKNHTFVNNKKIEKEVKIEPGISLRFGAVEAKLKKNG